MWFALVANSADLSQVTPCWLQYTTEVLTALSSMGWPLAALVFLLLCQREIRQFISELRVATLRHLGYEIAIAREPLAPTTRHTARRWVRRLFQRDEIVGVEGSPMPPSNVVPSIQSDSERGMVALANRQIRRAEYLQISARIWRKMQLVLVELKQVSAEHESPDVDRGARLLVENGFLPELFWHVLDRFGRIGIAVLANSPDLSPGAVDEAIVDGRALLNTLDNMLPTPKPTLLYAADLRLFQDEACTIHLAGVRGVLLVTFGPGAMIESIQVYPTTKPDYCEGEFVSCEMNEEKRWSSRTWYRDPFSGNAKVAFESSSEFVGRPLGAMDGEGGVDIQRWPLQARNAGRAR
jgi:hypothetical protein